MKTEITTDGWLAWHCPGCEGGHAVPVNGPKAWTWNGDREKPTLHPSVFVNKGRANPTAHVCHVWITKGQIQFLGDCTHALAGKTVDLEEF